MNLRQEFGGEAVLSMLGHQWEKQATRQAFKVTEEGTHIIPALTAFTTPTAAANNQIDTAVLTTRGNTLG